jgi:hypothetical protein
MPRKEQGGRHGSMPSRLMSMSEQQPVRMRSISTAMSVTPVSALGQPNSRPYGADISYDRESPEHVSGCKCDQFGTRTSLNALLAFSTGQEDWDALALAAGHGGKHGRRMRIRCSVSLACSCASVTKSKASPSTPIRTTRVPSGLLWSRLFLRVAPTSLAISPL